MVCRNCQCEGAGQKLRGADSVQLSIRMAIWGGVKKNDLRVDFVFAQHVRSQNKITQHGGRPNHTSIK